MAQISAVHHVQMAPPRWATLQRELLEVVERATWTYLARYARADGSLHYRDQHPGRDGADDFYESFYPLPYLYLLGGSDRLLAAAHHHWAGTTKQLAALGLVVNEYERGYDWFHQGEAQLLFYGLCLADPGNDEVTRRAVRFARLYAGGPNYDPVRNLIRAPHNGSEGPRGGCLDAPVYGWDADMEPYGLPLEDIDEIRTFDDLHDPVLAARVGDEMNRRARGDVAVNLAAIALVANAFCISGDPDLRDWVLRYGDGWLARAAENGGLLPDNVGPSGAVGEYFEGHWFGGHYGWTWPHGLLSVGQAAAILATVGRLLGRASASEPLRTILSTIEEQAKSDGDLLLVPHRRGRSGWFDYQPMLMALPTALWTSSLAQGDWERLRRWRKRETINWREVLPFRIKEDWGHERPWLSFLSGDNPEYPERILEASIEVVNRRLELLEADTADHRSLDIHHWQEHNPATLEALIQLTLGGPPPLYNGGLLLAAVRHFDPATRRPGLPADVAALVRRVTDSTVELELVNLSSLEGRRVVVQAGTFAEHSFTKPDRSWIEVQLPPRSRIELALDWTRYVNPPTSLEPWARSDP